MPTNEQLQAFYRVVRQFVLLSSYIAFVEILENGDLCVYVGRYDDRLARTMVYINPVGQTDYV